MRCSSTRRRSSELAGQLDVASVAGSAIFGSLGGRIVGAMICVGLISSISAMMWIGPRVMMTMGEDIPALRVFSKRSVSGAPAYAILFQLAVANLLLFTRSFEAVLDFIQFALLFCSFFTVPASSSCASPIPTCRGPIAPGDTRSRRSFSCS